MDVVAHLPERVVKLEVVFQNLKREYPSLNREPPLVFFHPSRLPNSGEVGGFVYLASKYGQGIEFDIRSTITGLTVQQGMFTDRLKGWQLVKDFSVLEEVFGEGRVAFLKEVVGARLKEGEELTFENFKAKLLARDLTFREIEALSRLGGEEVLEIGDFLNTYKHVTQDTIIPVPRLAVDFKDSDTTITGNVETALNGMVSTVEQLNLRFLTGSVHVAMWYDLGSFSKLRAILQGTAATPAIALPSDLLKKKGPQEFAEFARSAVRKDAVSFVLKFQELEIVANDILIPGKEANVYVPPDESQKPSLIIEALRKYPNITSIQLDVK